MTGTTLGIIAGGGALPFEIAAVVRAAGRPVFIAGIDGVVADEIADWPHCTFPLGTVAGVFRQLKAAGCIDLVIAGTAERPRLSSIRLDAKVLRSLPRVLSVMAGGDDNLVNGLIDYIEEHGFRVVGAHEAAPSLVCGSEQIGPGRLSKAEGENLQIGFDAIRHMGSLDIGQAVVVINRRIVAVEAAEGTDEMLRRIAHLRQFGRITAKPGRGVLVKAPKPDQELRIDMPTIGPDTADLVADAGLAGIGVAQNCVLIAQREKMEARIAKAGIFLAGRPFG